MSPVQIAQACRADSPATPQEQGRVPAGVPLLLELVDAPEGALPADVQAWLQRAFVGAVFAGEDVIDALDLRAVAPSQPDGLSIARGRLRLVALCRAADRLGEPEDTVARSTRRCLEALDHLDAGRSSGDAEVDRLLRRADALSRLPRTRRRLRSLLVVGQHLGRSRPTSMDHEGACRDDAPIAATKR